jgi:WD40 repeat protein
VSNAALDGISFGDIDFVVDLQNNIWVADNFVNKVYKFDSGGKLLTSWVISGYSPDEDHAEMAVDSQKNIYLRKAIYKGSVQKYDSVGTMIWSMDDTSLNISRISVAPDGYLYCKGSKKSDAIMGSYQGFIYKYNPDGTFNKSWKVNSHNLSEGILVKNGKVYCAGANSISLENDMNDNIIDIFDTCGTLLSSLHVRQKGDPKTMWVTAIAIDNNGNLYCTESESKTVRLYDKNTVYIGKFKMVPGLAYPNELAVLDDGTILIQIMNSTIISEQKQTKQY